MAELVDALISGVSGETRADSNSVVRTIEERLKSRFFLFRDSFSQASRKHASEKSSCRISL